MLKQDTAGVREVRRLGRKDTVTRAYIKQHTNFADAFNYYIFGGLQVIRRDQLRTGYCGNSSSLWCGWRRGAGAEVPGCDEKPDCYAG